MKEHSSKEFEEPESGTEDEPKAYSPQRESDGWTFNRRSFVALAAAVTVGTVLGVGSGNRTALARVVALVGQDTKPPLADVEEGQSFTKVWMLKNVGTEPWGQDASLQLRQGETLAEPLTLDLPNANPGEVVTVTAPMVATAGLQTSRIEASIHLTGTTYPVFLPVTYSSTPQQACTCDSDSPCTCESDSPCTCESDSPCTCEYYQYCTCDYVQPCNCDPYIPCTCDPYIPCPCEYHIPCVCDYDCGCVGYVPCGCDFHVPCGCVYYF